MRAACALLTLAACLCGGCAALVARSGRDLTELKTRQEVRARLGEPDATGTEGGQPYDEYRTRWKIAEPYAPRVREAYGMGLAMTGGLAELVYFPRELYTAARRAAAGQSVRFTYGAGGEVRGTYLDGESLYGLFGPEWRRPQGEDSEGPPPPGDDAAPVEPNSNRR